MDERRPIRLRFIFDKHPVFCHFCCCVLKFTGILCADRKSPFERCVEWTLKPRQGRFGCFSAGSPHSERSSFMLDPYKQVPLLSNEYIRLARSFAKACHCDKNRLKEMNLSERMWLQSDIFWIWKILSACYFSPAHKMSSVCSQYTPGSLHSPVTLSRSYVLLKIRYVSSCTGDGNSRLPGNLSSCTAVGMKFSHVKGNMISQCGLKRWSYINKTILYETLFPPEVDGCWGHSMVDTTSAVGSWEDWMDVKTS